MDPLKVLREAVHAVPAVKFAVGVAGIAAVVAIVLGLQIKPQIAIFGTLVVLALMFILVVFSRYAAAPETKSFVAPASLLVWFYTVAVIAATTLFMTSYFIHWPISVVARGELAKLKFFVGSWSHEKKETVEWTAGACAVSEVSVNAKSNLSVSALNEKDTSATGDYKYEYSGQVVHDGTTLHNCTWWQTNRPDYHYTSYRHAVIRCRDTGKCVMELERTSCAGDCVEVNKLPVSYAMEIPQGSRTNDSFDAISGDGASFVFRRVQAQADY